MIARLPAFRDSAFAEAKPGSGLTVSSGALWTDEAQCHWLDPANQAVTANLIQICRGFRNVALMKWYGQTSAFRTVAPSPTPLPPLRMRSYGRPPGSWLPAPVRASRSPSPILGISPSHRSNPAVPGEHCPGAGRRHCGSMRCVRQQRPGGVPHRQPGPPLRCIQRAAPFGMTSPCSSENILPIRRRLNPLL